MKNNNLLSFLCLLYCLIGTTSYTFGQNTSAEIKGILTDTVGMPLPNATVVLMQAEDSVMHSFTITDSKGRFSLSQVKNNSYFLQITYIGFQTIALPLRIQEGENVKNLGNLPMRQVSEQLKEIAITSERVPIVIKKDTIEYAAEAFKTKPNANVEELLKKLPGVEVDRDGTIKAQGKEVEKILVDGKEFFGDDPQIASKNLPADAIDKVQVFDELSEMSQFTGIDDGDREKTINLTLKEDRKKGYFGKIEAGYGSQDRYTGKFNMNRFNKKTKLSIIGAANNTNTQNFSIQDYINFSGGLSSFSGGGGTFQIDDDISAATGLGNNVGIRNIASLGTNLYLSPSSKTDIQASYFYNYLRNDLQSLSNRQNFQGAAFFQNTTNQNRLSNFHSHSLNAKITHKFNKNQDIIFRLQSKFNKQDVGTERFSQIFTGEDFLENQTDVLNGQDADGLNLTSSLMYRVRLKKTGRSIVARAQYTHNDNNREDILNSLYEVFNPIETPERVNQFQDENNNRAGYELRLTYTEPLGKGRFLQLNYRYNQSDREATKDFFDLPTVGEPIFNETLSSSFNNDYFFNRGGAKFYRQREKTKLMFGVDVQNSQLRGVIQNPESRINRDFLNILPNFRWEYTISAAQNLSIDYRTSVQEPSVEQLQPIVNNTNPQVIYAGNPNLQTEYVHSTRVNYSLFDQFSFTNLFVMVNARFTQNKIANASSIDEDFRQIISPQNVDYDLWLNSYLSFGTPIKPLGIKMNLTGNILYNQSILPINALENTVKRWINRIDVKLENRKKTWADVALGLRLDYNLTTYSQNSAQNQRFQTTTLYTDWNLDFLKRWNLNTRFEQELYAGSAFEDTQNISRWQVSLSKTFLKYDRGQLKLTVFDLLNQNRGINRNSTFNYIEDQRANALGRYFMMSFTYSFRNLAGKKRNKS